MGEECYEREIPMANLAAVCGHAHIARLNLAVELPSLAEDVAELGYPEIG